MDMSDEELMALLAELGSTDAQLGDLSGQLETARALRTAPAASPTVQAGNSVVPNYAGAIDRAVQGYMGRKQEKDLTTQRDALLGKQTGARQAYGQALMGQQKDPMRKKLEDELAAMGMPSLRF